MFDIFGPWHWKTLLVFMALGLFFGIFPWPFTWRYLLQSLGLWMERRTSTRSPLSFWVRSMRAVPPGLRKEAREELLRSWSPELRNEILALLARNETPRERFIRWCIDAQGNAHANRRCRKAGWKAYGPWHWYHPEHPRALYRVEVLALLDEYGEEAELNPETDD